MTARLEMVWEALQAWTAYKKGTLEALQNRPLAQILENMGEIAGERLGRDGPCTMRFGQWLAQAVTGWHSGLSNDEEIDALNALPSLRGMRLVGARLAQTGAAVAGATARRSRSINDHVVIRLGA